MNKYDCFHIPHLITYLQGYHESKTKAGLKSIIFWADLKCVLDKSNLKELDR